MIVWVVKNGKWEGYKRTGKCKQCGKCCRSHTIPFSMQAYMKSQEGRLDLEKMEQEDRDKLEGYVYFWSLGMWWEVHVGDITSEGAKICEKLSPENQCEVWMNFDHFKALCLFWPMDPYAQKHFPDCGFSFKEVSQDDREAD